MKRRERKEGGKNATDDVRKESQRYGTLTSQQTEQRSRGTEETERSLVACSELKQSPLTARTKW